MPSTRKPPSRPAGLAALAAWLLASSAGCDLFRDLDRFEQRPEPPSDAGGRDAGRNDGGRNDAGRPDMEDDAGMDVTDAGTADAGDAGTQEPELGCSNPRTLCVRVDRFSPHLDELVTVDLVTVADDILRARAIVAPMGAERADFVLPLAIPEREVPASGEEHPLQLEIFADQNKDAMYTPGGADHEWKVELPPSGNVVFQHNSEFSSIDPPARDIGGDFRMQFSDMGPHLGQRVEVMVIEEASGRTVGLYRIPELQEEAFEVVIPGIIDPGGVVYRLEFYGDANGNLSYDDHPVDHTWVKFVESGQDGVSTSFTHGTDFVDLEYQFEFEP